ncbi:hypothetical protein [Archangium sp.]
MKIFIFTPVANAAVSKQQAEETYAAARVPGEEGPPQPHRARAQPTAFAR